MVIWKRCCAQAEIRGGRRGEKEPANAWEANKKQEFGMCIRHKSLLEPSKYPSEMLTLTMSPPPVA